MPEKIDDWGIKSQYKRTNICNSSFDISGNKSRALSSEQAPNVSKLNKNSHVVDDTLTFPMIKVLPITLPIIAHPLKCDC